MAADFGYIEGEFINLYSEENPILEVGDICYALVTNVKDYYYPLIISGIVVQYKITEGQNRIYYIAISSILESPKIINTFVNKQQFEIVPFKDEYVHAKKKILITRESDFKDTLFPVEAFFVRKTESQIKDVRNYYLKIIQKDLKIALLYIDELLTHEL